MYDKEITIDEELSYVRHEFHYEPEPARGNLLSLVYDIPYFGACGVFPPFHIANQTFASGGGDGGMSPGASWEPFQLTKDTYGKLVNLVKNTPPQTLKGKSRYYHIQFIEDSSFDKIQELFEWQEAVCNKHREWYHEQNRKIQDINE